MKQKVLVFAALPAVLLQKLHDHFEVADFTGKSGLRSNPGFVAALSEADGVIGAGMPFDKVLIDQAPRLKVLSSITVGYDNYDVAALTARRILLCNTPDVLTESVADVAVALMLGVARRTMELGAMVRAGQWKRSLDVSQFGSDVYGKRLGILGMGRIGAAIAQRAHHGFGMPVFYNNRSRKPEYEQRFKARYLDLDSLLAESDFVCIVLPLSPQTRGLIGVRELALMRKTAYLINVARGAIVDEPALIAAVQSGQIAGAGLDVFAKEPLPQDSPLMTQPNVVALPHIGSATRATRYAMAELAVENLVAALSGCSPKAMVNPEVLVDSDR